MGNVPGKGGAGAAPNPQPQASSKYGGSAATAGGAPALLTAPGGQAVMPTSASSAPQAASAGQTATAAPSPQAATQTTAGGLQQAVNGTPGMQLGANQTNGTPDAAQSNAFIPSVLSNPFEMGINNATQTSNYASQALPAAGQFQQNLFSSGVNPESQSYLNAAGNLSANQLAQTQASLGGMFENSASSSGLAPAMLQAANQSSEQLAQLAGQLGTSQLQTAAQALPNAFQFPNTAAAAGMQSANGLYSLGQNIAAGATNQAQSAANGTPQAAPVTISQPQQNGGK